MDDADIVAYIRLLSRSLDHALTNLTEGDVGKAKAEIRIVQDGLDQIAYQLRRRDTSDQTMH